jgi:excisionase family DNA binding protein
MRSSNSTPASPKSVRFYTVPEVATMLSVSERTVWRWVKHGELLHHKFGRSVRVSHADLMAFLGTHRDD